MSWKRPRRLRPHYSPAGAEFMQPNGLTFANSRMDLDDSIGAKFWTRRLLHPSSATAADFREHSRWPANFLPYEHDLLLMEGKQ
jgi:hypothetical protein